MSNGKLIKKESRFLNNLQATQHYKSVISNFVRISTREPKRSAAEARDAQGLSRLWRDERTANL